MALVCNPEFLREGFAVQDTLKADRIVIGCSDDAARELLEQAYRPIIDTGVPVVVTDYPTAEVKVAANSYLATKMSFINAMAEVCEATGADVTQLATAIGHDARIGPLFLRSGLGFGGGCLPKDIGAFMARAGELDVDQPVAFLKDVDEINLRRRSRMVDLAGEMCDGSLAGRRVAPSAVDACRAADVVLHLTEGRECREPRPEDLGTVVGERNIVDGWSVLDAKVWRSAGWTFRALGRP